MAGNSVDREVAHLKNLLTPLLAAAHTDISVATSLSPRALSQETILVMQAIHMFAELRRLANVAELVAPAAASAVAVWMPKHATGHGLWPPR